MQTEKEKISDYVKFDHVSYESVMADVYLKKKIRRESTYNVKLLIKALIRCKKLGLNDVQIGFIDTYNFLRERNMQILFLGEKRRGVVLAPILPKNINIYKLPNRQKR